MSSGAGSGGGGGSRGDLVAQRVRMDLTPFAEMTTERKQAIQQYVESQVIEQQAAAQRVQEEADATQAQADKERRRTQPEEQDSRGSDGLPTDRLVAEGLTRVLMRCRRRSNSMPRQLLPHEQAGCWAYAYGQV